MLDYAAAKVEKLKGRGFENAMLYDPSGVGGLHMMYVVPRGDMLEDYGLPADPQVPGTFFSALSVLRKLGTVSVWGGLLASAIFYLRTGRRQPPPEDEAVAEAERLGRQPATGSADGARSGPCRRYRRRAGRRCPDRRAAGRRANARPAAGGGAMTVRRARVRGRMRAAAARGSSATRSSSGCVHWWSALTFIALMVSGFALGYPRLAFLSGLFGGGQTMRFLHPWFGVGFTLGVVWMLFSWAKDMRFERRRPGVGAAGCGPTPAAATPVSTSAATTPARRATSGSRSSSGLVLLVTGLPLWYPWLAGRRASSQIARLAPPRRLPADGRRLHGPRLHVDRDVPGDDVGHDDRPGHPGVGRLAPPGLVPGAGPPQGRRLR